METIIKNHPNFRDLGGIKTINGKLIKEKTLFRSGFLRNLDESELLRLTDLNVTKVIDLRTTSEIDRTGEGSYPEKASYENIAINAGNISNFLIPIFEKGEIHLLKSNLLEEIYFDVITNYKTELAAVYRTIIHANEGVLYHCSHGKDRTGIISALLLDFFEVDRKHIFQDYLMSNETLKKTHEYQLHMIKDNFVKKFNRDLSEEEFAPVKSLFYCREDLLTTVFDQIDNEYHSVNNYFQTELGLNEAELELLKSKYLV